MSHIKAQLDRCTKIRVNYTKQEPKPLTGIQKERMDEVAQLERMMER